MIDYDAELRAHNERFRAATGVAPGNHVLDIGCGAGQSTRDAARAATAGRVLGVDVSAPMLEQARRLTIAEQLDNATYEHGDAQVHPFAPGDHDLAISRFGTMFFSDPAAAFSNIARALRVGGRLVLLVWQSRERNEWAVAIGTALNGPAQPIAPAMKAFSLGDRTATASVLESAGFDDVRFSDVREPVFYGPDVASAMDFVLGFTSETLASMPATDAARARERLRDTLHDHGTAHDGVVFDSRAWLITAHRR